MAYVTSCSHRRGSVVGGEATQDGAGNGRPVQSPQLSAKPQGDDGHHGHLEGVRQLGGVAWDTDGTLEYRSINQLNT